MKDRVPENPGRVLITPEDETVAFFATITRADNPIQEGTPLNKATFMKDETAELLGLESDDPTVDEALAKLGTAMTVEAIRAICI